VGRVGEAFTLLPHLKNEIFVMAREALINASRHAVASHITVRLDYGRLLDDDV
jgi:signal transduction histidine kinase